MRLPKALIHQKYTTVIVHLIKPIGADTFENDAQQVFLQYVTSQRSSRIVVMWDIGLDLVPKDAMDDHNHVMGCTET